LAAASDFGNAQGGPIAVKVFEFLGFFAASQLRLLALL
jgi:hypothetical protein